MVGYLSARRRLVLSGNGVLRESIPSNIPIRNRLLPMVKQGIIPSARTTRAKIACSACRTRKVRCDVAHRGSPCTNCFLDHKECRVPARCGRHRNPERQKNTQTRNSQPAPNQEELPIPTSTSKVTKEQDVQSALNPLDNENSTSTPAILLHLLQNHTDSSAEQGLRANGADIADISFSVYRFLKSDFLVKLHQDDIKYLEDQACLRVPKRDTLDEILKQYFEHIHPLLPLLNEPQFWRMYHPVRYAGNGQKQEPTSLFVLQAMLFAACSFVAPSKLRRLGFNSARHARKCLYRRAKLLYSLDTESDALCLAQGALLLSLWCPRDNGQRVNTWWLTVAVQHARSVQASSGTEQLYLKRLWWSCIVRDRVMSLGFRQPILITREPFNFEVDKLTVDDIDGDGPGVYEKEVKRALLVITVSMCDLCTTLTDILALIYPPVPPHPPEDCSHTFLRIKRLRENVNTWCQDMNYHLALIQMHQRSHASVIMYSNLLQMYFHSALVLLANYEIQLEVESHPPCDQDQALIRRNKLEVRDSTVSITELLRDLVIMDLVKYLPTSAVTCAAQPLVLWLLDLALAQEGALSTASSEQGMLAVVLEAMKVYQSLYDNTDYVLETAYRISLEARSIVQDHAIMDWGDILVQNPKAYLRFIFTMDVALAKGSFPEDSDLPSATLKPNPQCDGSKELDNCPAVSISKVDKPVSTQSPAQARSPEDMTVEGALVMPSTGEFEAWEDNNPVCKKWNSFADQESLLVESDIELQNLIEMHFEDALNACGDPNS